MYPNGYLKVYMEEKERTDVGTVSGLTEMGVQMIINDDDVEIIEQRSRTEQIEQPMQGPTAQQGQMQMVDVEVFDLKIRTTKQVMELRVDPVPPEECLVDKELTTLNLDEADFVCHRVQKTFTQLVNEGYDSEELDQVGSGDNHQWNDERVNRLFYEDEDPDTEGNDDPSMRQFWVHECHAWFDNDGTGVAQQRRVVLIGDQVFENVETNYQPLIAMSAILMQHKHTGMSYVDIVKDLQILSSVLTRQLLDNIYKINVGKTVFSEDALTEDGATMEALLNRQAEYIPVRGPAMAAFAPEPTQSMVGDLLPVIQHFSRMKAERTGVTPEATVDANALQEVRQEVFSNAMDRASQRIEMLTRIFAETGFRQLMLKTHQLLRSHWDVAQSIKLRGEWIDVDPQGWRDRTDMTINVGLGHHTKQQQLGMLVQLLSMQKEAAAAGLSDPKKIYNTLERVINASGIGDVRQAFIDPGTTEKPNPEYKPPQPQPDANMILAQAQAQALEREQERKGQEFQAKTQHDQQKLQQDGQLKHVEMQSKSIDQQQKGRELEIKEREMVLAGELKKGELDELVAKTSNIQADTQLKLSNSDKAMAEAVAVAVENSEVYQQALRMVEKGGDLNEDTLDGQSEGQDNAEESEGGESSE